MDKPVTGAYVGKMRSRFVAILALISIAVVTMLTSAHSAQMSAKSGNALQAVDMVLVNDLGDRCCNGTEPCVSSGSDLCRFVCSGLSVYLLLPVESIGRDAGSGQVELPSGLTLSGRTPELNEHPPKLRLL
ncbi:hypothetical protein ABWH89_13910 [Hoeflea alexandrii]|uniref:hypothetical protein n=1 Tax=Hoeflea alexandrii TaxID=288436 RepID=UPI0035D0BF74